MLAPKSGMLRSTNLPFSRILLVTIALAGLLSAGCVTRVYGRGYSTVHVRYSEPVVFVEAPELVYVGPGVYVVRDYDEAVYYSDGYYWTYRGGVWYHTAYWNEPWVVVSHVHVVPTVVVHQDHHAYVHYHGAVGAATYRQPARSYHTASVSAHGGSPQPPPADHSAASSVSVKGKSHRVSTAPDATASASAGAGASVQVNPGSSQSHRGGNDGQSASSASTQATTRSHHTQAQQPDAQASVRTTPAPAVSPQPTRAAAAQPQQQVQSAQPATARPKAKKKADSKPKKSTRGGS